MRQGMTLLEAILAMTLLGVAVVGLMQSATLATRNQQRCNQRMTAVYLAQEKLADVQTIGPHVWSLGHPLRGTEARGTTPYEWNIAIEQQAVGELFTVQVTVTWPGPGGGEVTLETWLNDYEAKAAEEKMQEKPSGPTGPNTARTG